MGMFSVDIEVNGNWHMTFSHVISIFIEHGQVGITTDMGDFICHETREIMGNDSITKIVMIPE